MNAIQDIAAAYVIAGFATLCFAASKPWFLSAGDIAFAAGLWPLFWIRYFWS